jgi:malate/lactate dehydrogenase
MPVKITIVGGGGGVGSSAAFNLLVREGEHEVVLTDVRDEMVVSHVMDLEQVLEQGGTGSIRGGSPDDVLDSDVVVLTAAVPLTLNVSRLVYLRDNAEILGEIGDRLVRAGSWNGVLILVTNPVDPLCTWLRRRTGIDRHRLLGYTLNDCLRLRTGIARAVGAGPGSVDAWVVGEHGDSFVPLLDSTRIDGERAELDADQRAHALDFVRTWYVRHVALDSGRSSTWTSGLGVARMITAIADDSGDLWPASVVLEGEYGVESVALSVPVSLGRGGARRIHEWPLSPADQAALERSAQVVREAIEQLDGGWS